MRFISIKESLDMIHCSWNDEPEPSQSFSSFFPIDIINNLKFYKFKTKFSSALCCVISQKQIIIIPKIIIKKHRLCIPKNNRKHQLQYKRYYTFLL